MGVNIAITEGAVVHCEQILELIQYRPLRETIPARPILIVPPQINKFYVYDLTAEKSMVRFLLERGFQVFMVSWRNPTAEHRNWGLEDYVDAIERALAATSAISGSREVHTPGLLRELRGGPSWIRRRARRPRGSDNGEVARL